MVRIRGRALEPVRDELLEAGEVGAELPRSLEDRYLEALTDEPLDVARALPRGRPARRLRRPAGFRARAFVELPGAVAERSMSAMRLSGSKLTFVTVEKSASIMKMSTSRSLSPSFAARLAYIEIPFTAYSKTSWSVEVVASLPQTPVTVQPVPFVVCSHW
jgi:hypothetical protein